MHISVEPDGRMNGLTPRGWFHVRWLHLNRPQLVELRLWLQREQELRHALAQQHETTVHLQQRLLALEAELIGLRELIASLSTISQS